jgi:uncharacterized protein (DUF885 family)
VLIFFSDPQTKKYGKECMNENFNRLADEILEYYWKNKPVDATFLGIHKYDHTFGKQDLSSHKEFLNGLETYFNQLKIFEKERVNLSPDEWMDYIILKNSLEVEITFERETERMTRDASIYPQMILYGLYLLVMRNFAPFYERMEKVLERLKEVPQILIVGRENLTKGKNIPKVWTEIGIEITESGGRFLLKTLEPFIEETSLLKNELIEARYAAFEAFSRYLRFLQNELLSRSDGDFSIGKDLFEFLLKKEHQLSYSSEELLSIGENIIVETKASMNRLSREIDETQSPEDLITRLKGEHPTRTELLNYYEKEMGRAKEFVIHHDLVSIPDGETLSVVETPLFERPRIPYAAYIPPAPFEKNQNGIFWVTPVEKENLEPLKDHSKYKIVVTALHEAYPGHHLQFVHSNKIKSKIRRQFFTPLFTEGWALYCEEMMYENGFYTDPKIRLLQLKGQLWRACRVIIDVKLHLKKMDIDDAVDMLVNVARLERAQAIGEVKRYTQTPTQPMSYIMGKQEILKLRDEVKELRPNRFNIRDFHNELLSFGTIPIGLIRERILNP